jgi:hypothetical protein
MKTFFLFFIMQYIMYFLLTCNFRAVAQGKYFYTISTDMMISAAQFWLVKKIGEAGNLNGWYGMIAGGGLGSITGIWITKKIFKS